MGNLYCDNYKTCNSVILDRGLMEDTEARARAKGWHIFHGLDHGGKTHDAVLCVHCVNTRRIAMNPAPPALRGQQELFSIEAVVEDIELQGPAAERAAEILRRRGKIEAP
jgi:hypothetical protein